MHEAGGAPRGADETTPADTGLGPGPADTGLAGGGEAGKPHVLLADDPADMREYLQRLLRPSYRVTTVTDGTAALDAARTRPPDLVIGDVAMPGLDGPELAAALRADPRTADVPVLLLSEGPVLSEGPGAGAGEYLVPPFSAAELLARVRTSIELARVRARQNDEQRETALALQRAILGPVPLPGGFSARYEPATRPLEVGGDWHDITELPDGQIAIVVGDCLGHDLRAATVMGQMRSACRALLLQDASPSRVLSALDRFAASVPGGEYTTVFCAVLEPETGRLSYSAAGHPPGIVARPDGTVSLLDGAHSLPLTAAPDTGRPEAEYTLPPRSALLLYTDGLVERRGQSLTDGITAAGAAVAGGGEESLEDLASALMARLAPADGYGDDVALVLYRHPGPLELTFPARVDQLGPVRAYLRRWLQDCAPGTGAAQDFLVAAGEAVANAIEHGHRDRPGDIRLRAVATAGRLRLAVTDSGDWLRPGPEPAPYRGKGIFLMRAMMDNVSIDPGPEGTTVTMDVRVSGENA